MITIPETIDKKHIREIKKFAGDGFSSGFSYKNDKGGQRMVLLINYPVGCSVPGGKSNRQEGDTTITFIGEGGQDQCSISEWYQWLGGSWTDGEASRGAVDPLEEQAKLLSKAQKTVPFTKTTEDKDHNWQKHFLKEKKKTS